MAEKRATIAHISDLHISRKTSRDVAAMLKRVLKTVDPDILVVSGDLANQPVPWQMRKAAALLKEIVEECQPGRVIVIPGNHDFKLWGNLGLLRFSRIPFEIFFRPTEPPRSPWARAVLLFENALQYKGAAMREPATLDRFAELGIALFTINSNTPGFTMAGGKVNAEDLQQLYGKFDELAKKPEESLFYKVVVVHHHPAPVANAPFNAVARLQDSFMLFYNAGLFIRELSRRGCNLVLHGHKHVAGFVRVGCDFRDLGRTVLPVAAAGTAAHPHPDDERGHHLNVVEIFDDDTARLDSWFFSATEERKDASYRHELDTLADVRRRRYAIYRKARQYSCNRVIKTVEITTDGYTDVRIDFSDCRAASEDGLEHVPLSLTTGRPSYLRGVRTAPGSSEFVNIEAEQSNLYRFAGRLNLGGKYKPESGPFQYGYCYRLMNGHALTAGEFARHYAGTDMDSEYASISCDQACDVMALEVRFPQNYELDSLEFRAIAGYVPAPLRGVDDERLDSGKGVKRHDGETGRIRGNVRRQPAGYVLTIPDPVPGMIYRLCWKFKLEEANTEELAAAATVAEVRRKLLEVAAKAAHEEAAGEIWKRGRRILDDLACDIVNKLEGAPEKLLVSATIFDEQTQRLRFVCSNTEPEAMPKIEFYAGEGCAGFAFEKARHNLYHSQRNPGYYIARSEWPADDAGKPVAEPGPDPTALASFPWFHSGKDVQRRVVVGVVNVSSRAATTSLLRLFDGKAEDRAARVKALQDLVDVAAADLFRQVQ